MTPSSSHGAEFSATQWSVVLAAAEVDSTQAREALAKLCRSYWRPLYLFVRQQGLSVHDAQDLTQAFFERLLEKNYLDQVNPGKGRFRSFLIACLKHFLANQRDRAKAIKRGGRHEFVSIDAESVEARIRIDGVQDETADRFFDREWAVVTAVLDKAPRPIREFRKDVPSGLVQIIGRCLAKRRDGRFAGYAPLREALLPYSSAVPEPAHLGVRIQVGNAFVFEAVLRRRLRFGTSHRLKRGFRFRSSAVMVSGYLVSP